MVRHLTSPSAGSARTPTSGRNAFESALVSPWRPPPPRANPAHVPRRLSPAQRAVQITFVLKGHLKNMQLAYLRAAALLARMRDEKLYRALKHESLEDYADVRLGLQRAALYRYLQIYDWVREFHPAWLARRPKGFIPELTDAYALMWIERRLRDPHLGEALRAELEAMRRKALAGRLSSREFEELRHRGRKRKTSLDALLTGLRALRRRAAAGSDIPAAILDGLDGLIRQVQAAVDAAGHVARLVGLPRSVLARGAARVAKSLRA